MNKEALDTAAHDDGAQAEAPPRLASLARSLMVPSRNVRTYFDPTWIQELAADIKARGILQPLLVRPLPGSRLQETFEDRLPGQPAPTHEIVDGECRWRAGEIANVAEFPVLIRHLSDVEVVQVQLVASLRRKNLHPLEEAEGFERLVNDHKLSIAEIAVSIDKSESYVYKSLKLIELTPECRQQMHSGKLSQSIALLVARAPAYLQAQIARDVMQPQGMDQEPMSYRAAVRHIQQHYMLQLEHAVFDIKDANLVDKAGSCVTCTKNTGCNKDMFGDVAGGDTCTDPKCFDSKKVAHFAMVAKAAAAKGQKVIQGKEAKELMPHEHSSPKGYKLLDSNEYINGRNTTLRKLVGKDGPPPVVIINPHTQVAQEALPNDVASRLIKKAEAQKAAASATSSGGKAKKAPSEQELKNQFDDAWKMQAAREIFTAATSGKMKTISVDFARRLGIWFCDNLPYGALGDLIDELLEVGKIGKNAGTADYFAKCPANMVAPALLLTAALCDFDNYNGTTPLAGVVARDAGVDLTKVKERVKADMKAAAADAKGADRHGVEGAVKAIAASTPKTTPKKAPAKAEAKKTTAAEAKAGISQGLKETDAQFKAKSMLTAVVKDAAVLSKLAKARNPLVATRDDLANLTVDELVAITGQTADDAKALITKAREGFWIAAPSEKAEKDFSKPAIGCRVRIKATAKNHAGLEGMLGPNMGDSWKVVFDKGTSGRAMRGDFVVIPPAKAVNAAAWPFPTASKPADTKAARK